MIEKFEKPAAGGGIGLVRLRWKSQRATRQAQ
jgi:hypothetical protein